MSDVQRASLLRAMDDALSNAETSASLRGKDAARRAAMWSGIASAYAAKLMAVSVAGQSCSEAHLGLASTKTLLTELHARFTATCSTNGSLARVNREAARHIGDMLDELPQVVLDYRTIKDEEER